MEGFFSNGVTRAVFIVVGTIPFGIDKLTVFVMVGKRQVKCSVSNHLLKARKDSIYRPLRLDYPLARSWGRL